MTRASRLHRARGFTFVELMMTLAIMAVLVMVAVPMVEINARREKERDLRRALVQIRDGLDAYKRASDQGRIQMKIGDSGYPKTLDELVEGVPDQRSPVKQKMFFLRSVPRDPMNPDTVTKASATWGLRSYASPPDDPQEGADVFDVFTRADGAGLNNVPYRQW